MKFRQLPILLSHIGTLGVWGGLTAVLLVAVIASPSINAFAQNEGPESLLGPPRPETKTPAARPKTTPQRNPNRSMSDPFGRVQESFQEETDTPLPGPFDNGLDRLPVGRARRAPAPLSRQQALAEFNREQNTFANEIKRLKKQLDRLEQLLAQRRTHQQSIIESKMRKPANSNAGISLDDFRPSSFDADRDQPVPTPPRSDFSNNSDSGGNRNAPAPVT